MKLQTNFTAGILDPLTQHDISNLTTVTNETFAAEFLRRKKRNFTAAELWDIQRKKKNVAPRRAFL